MASTQRTSRDTAHQLEVIGHWARPPTRRSSLASHRYERWVRTRAGGPPDLEFAVTHRDGKPIWFDGVRQDADGQVLLEAKGHYACFIDPVRDDWFPWYRWSERSGLPALIGQARRQVEAAQGVPVEWLCAELSVADLLGDEFRASPALSGRVSARFEPMSG